MDEPDSNVRQPGDREARKRGRQPRRQRSTAAAGDVNGTTVMVTSVKTGAAKKWRQDGVCFDVKL
jgi:hypothetical protein